MKFQDQIYKIKSSLLNPQPTFPSVYLKQFWGYVLRQNDIESENCTTLKLATHHGYVVVHLYMSSSYFFRPSKVWCYITRQWGRI